MRLIDADKLLEAVEGLPIKQMTLEIFKPHVIRAITDAPTVGGWVSVQDRLPKLHPEEDIDNIRPDGVKTVRWFESEDVIVYSPKGVSIGICSLEADGRMVWLDDHLGDGNRVSHWMPLPEPPEEVSGDA